MLAPGHAWSMCCFPESELRSSIFGTELHAAQTDNGDHPEPVFYRHATALRAIEVQEEGRLFDDPLAAQLAGPDALRQANDYAQVRLTTTKNCALTTLLSQLEFDEPVAAHSWRGLDAVRQAHDCAKLCRLLENSHLAPAHAQRLRS